MCRVPREDGQPARILALGSNAVLFEGTLLHDPHLFRRILARERERFHGRRAEPLLEFFLARQQHGHPLVIVVATRELGVVVRNEYVSMSTFGPSFFIRPLYLRQMPGNANSGRGSLPVMEN